jgi:DNA topoisomerase-1
LVDYAFTAKMEDDLDAIAGGSEESVPYLRRFYFGSQTDSPVSSGRAKRVAKQAVAGDKGEGLGLKSLVADRLDEIDARAINSLPLGADDEGREVVIRVGRYGPYLQRGEDTTSIPDDLPPDELTIAKATELLAAPRKERELGTDPETGKQVLLRSGKYGPYVQLGDAEPQPAKKPKKGSKAAAAEKAAGPKTASLLPRHDPATLELSEALRLLSVPRTLGVDPSDGKTITAQFGPFGPYIAKEKADGKKDTRNLADEDQVFTVTLPEALALFATPKVRQRREPAAPLKELGDDPVSKKPILAKNGKFGIYVTDGVTNASLRREDSLERLTPERAQELLQERRDKEASGALPPPKKKAASKRPTKRAAKKA